MKSGHFISHFFFRINFLLYTLKYEVENGPRHNRQANAERHQATDEHGVYNTKTTRGQQEQ
ncbi:hypothetical protein D3C76_1807580 [compost metagenome]